MTAHELSARMTEQEAENVIKYWAEKNADKLVEFKSLVRLGDSKRLAVATVMLDKKYSTETYEQAYYS